MTTPSKEWESQRLHDLNVEYRAVNNRKEWLKNKEALKSGQNLTREMARFFE